MNTRMILLLSGAGVLLAAAQTLAQPIITIQPEDQSVCLNDPARFRVVARSSSGGLTYGWWFNEAPLDPALNPTAARATLTLSNVTEALAGGYSAVVSDDNGSVTSRVARLTLDPTFARVLEPGFTNETVYSFGSAWGDYDNDGFVDLFVANGAEDGARRNFLYHNKRDGTFARMTSTEAGPIVSDQGDFAGAAWGDINNDGLLDLLATQGWSSSKPAKFYFNLGNGSFSSILAGDLGTVRGIASAVNWGDYDNDGFLDVFLPTAWGPIGIYTNRLFRNRGDGTFELVKAGPVVTDRIPGDASWGSNCPAWGDYDNDGDLDLVVANYGVPRSYFYENDGQGNFRRLTESLFETTYSPMNLAWGDYDNDGDLDLAVTYDGRIRLFRNDGTTGLIVAANWSTPSGGAAPFWADYDNDAHLDLLIGRGQGAPSLNLLYHNNGDGTFTQVTGGIAAQSAYWLSGSWGDYDNDGFMDLFVTERYGHNVLYQNRKNANHWLKVKLVGTASNRAAIGAKVRVKATIAGKAVWQLREVSGGLVAQDDLRPNFGLGDATVAEVVRIEWPSGNLQEYRDQPVDLIRTITEPTRIQPPRPTASLGGSVTLANVSGTGTYQWRFNGVDLAGKTNRTLGLTNIQTSHQGRYSVVVTASGDTVTTNFASLLVDTQFTKITTGPVVNDAAGSGIGLWTDYDNDGFIDLMVTRSPGANSLFRNNRDGTFAGMTPADAGALVADVGSCNGAAWGDLDNDGQDEFFAARGGVSSGLYRRGADGRFERVADAGAIVTDSSYKQGCSLGDYDNDGYLDAFVATAGGGTGWHNNSLYHNDGDGTFSKVLSGPVATTYFEHTESGLWGDADGDGDPDLLVLNYQSLALFANEGHGTFTRVSKGTLPRDLGNYAAWGDYDNDGRLDLFVGCWQTPSRLWHNEGSGGFTRTLLAGGGEGFNGSWGDYDNDGCLDLFVPRGEGNGESDLLYRNNGDGSFTQVGIGSLVSEPGHSEAASWGDYDNDGFLDLFVGNTSGENDFLYHNHGNTNHWLMFRLIGTVSNRSAVGAKVRVGASIRAKQVWQVRELSGGPLGNDRRVHFGLGNATKANVVRIEWPSGIVQELTNLKANQIVTVTEPPRLESLRQGRLRLLCWARQNYEIEASNDLATWTSLGVVATDLNRPEVIDPGAAGHPYRFYRALGR